MTSKFISIYFILLVVSSIKTKQCVYNMKYVRITSRMWVIFFAQLKTYVCCRLVKMTDTTSRKCQLKNKYPSWLCSSEHLVYRFQLRFRFVRLNRNDVHTGYLLHQDLLTHNKKLITYISKHFRHTRELINLMHEKGTLLQLHPSIVDKIIRRKKEKERPN